jgi:hypothetical protein
MSLKRNASWWDTKHNNTRHSGKLCHVSVWGGLQKKEGVEGKGGPGGGIFREFPVGPSEERECRIMWNLTREDRTVAATSWTSGSFAPIFTEFPLMVFP